MPVKITLPMIVGTLHPNIGGWLGAYITRNNLKPWYESLNKPSWTPPRWAFAPVWTGLYCTMGFSSYLVWKESGGFKQAALPLAIYGTNLALNWAWTPIFFGAHNIKLALYDIVLLWSSTVAMGIAFYRVNPVAGYLVIPYLIWGSFATALNYIIYRDNPPIDKTSEEKKE